MKVDILAGGLGSRLSEEISLKPKPMIDIGPDPILLHIMKIYAYHGFNNFEIVCKVLKTNLIDSEIPISYSPRSKTDGKKIRAISDSDGLKSLIVALKARFF